MRVEQQVDTTIGFERPHVEVVMERADLVDANHLAARLDHPEVGMRAPVYPSRVAQPLGGDRAGCGWLAHARRPMEQVRVRGTVGERRLEQALCLDLLG